MFNKRDAHPVNGLDALIERLDALPGLVGVAIERSDGIIVDRLRAAGFAVFPVSPRVSARARERHQATARKNDRFDAFVLAETLRTDGHRWRALRPASDLHAELRQIVRHRRQAVESQIMVEAQLRETLLAYHPAVVGLFSAVHGDATLAFLRDHPTPRAAVLVATEQRKNRLNLTGKVRGWKQILNTLSVHYGERVTYPSLATIATPRTHQVGQACRATSGPGGQARSGKTGGAQGSAVEIRSLGPNLDR